MRFTHRLTIIPCILISSRMKSTERSSTFDLVSLVYWKMAPPRRWHFFPLHLFHFIRTTIFEPRLSVLKKYSCFQLQMFLKCSYFFHAFQVKFKNVLNFVHVKLNENICFCHLFLHWKNKDKYLILLITFTIKINKIKLKQVKTNDFISCVQN